MTSTAQLLSFEIVTYMRNSTAPPEQQEQEVQRMIVERDRIVNPSSVVQLPDNGPLLFKLGQQPVADVTWKGF